MSKMSRGLKLISLCLITFISLAFPTLVNAQVSQPETYFHRGKVTSIVKEERTEEGGYPAVHQQVIVKLTTKQEVNALYTLPLGSNDKRLLQPQTEVVIVEQKTDNDSLYFVTDIYRLPRLLIVFGLFILLIVVFSGFRGVTALAGLGFSIWLLLYYVVPSIAGGADPMTVSLISSVVIAGISLYLAHGFNRRTSISLASTLVTLVLAVIAAVSFVSLTKLFGLGSEESLELQYGAVNQLNLQGLLLAGIIIGALGVLDDITTAQTAAIEEIHRANPKLTFHDLYTRGMSVGREHITSLVNTLALAYAGASLPMLLLFTVYHQPLWVTLNSEFVVEEVVRTVVGSLALTLAVPITTLFAAYWYTRVPLKPDTNARKSSAHSH